LKSDDVSDWPLPNKIPGCAPVQKQWLKEFTWLAYSNIYNGAFCKWCVLFAPQTVSRSAKPPGSLV